MSAQTKCIFEELNANVIVVGEYKAVNKDNPTVPVYLDVRVGTQAPQLQRLLAGVGKSGLQVQPFTMLAGSVQPRIRWLLLCTTTARNSKRWLPCSSVPDCKQVTDPSGATVSESKAQHQGQFAFTSKVAGEYQACFSTHGGCCRTCQCAESAVQQHHVLSCVGHC